MTVSRTIQVFSLIFLISLLRPVLGQTSFCDTRRGICLYGTSDAYGRVITIHSSATGWVGFGIGSSMANADVFAVWLNSYGQPVLSRRTSQGRYTPPYNPNLEGATFVPLAIRAPAGMTMAVSIRLPARYNAYPALGLIYAYSPTPPPMRDSPASSFPDHHGNKGAVPRLDFAPAPQTAPTQNTAMRSFANPSALTQWAMTRQQPSTASASSITLSGRGVNSKAVAATSPSNRFCEQSQTFCLHSQPDQKASTIVFTIHSAAQGWAGFGIGASMANADMYVGWRNSTGGYVISRRSPQGYSTPSVNPQSQGLSVVPLSVPAPPWARLAFSFKKPLDSSITPNSQYIFAYADGRAMQPDSPASNFPKHSSVGKIQGVNFLSVLATNSTGESTKSEQTKPIIDTDAKSYKLIIQAHGILMFIAWAVAPFLGIFIARYLKDLLGVWWYRLHLFVMLGVTGLFTLASFTLMVLYMQGRHLGVVLPEGFAGNSHTRLGLVVTLITVIQVILGFVSNALWTPTRTSVPWWDKVHWWIGRLVFLFGLMNTYTGLYLYVERYEAGPAILISFWIIVGLGLGGLVYGEWKFGQVNHVHAPGTNDKPHSFMKDS